MKQSCTKIALTLLLLTWAIGLSAQSREKSSFTGYVYAVGTESGGRTTQAEPLPYATVYLPQVGLFATTADDGYFEIEGVTLGRYTVEITALGYEDFSQQVEITRVKEF